MPFLSDVAFAGDVGKTYGKYHSTFQSQGGQVMALLYEQGEWLVAHVSFNDHLKPEDITDAYLGELNKYASSKGFGGKLRIVYAE